MELSWSAPEDRSGEAVTGYKVYQDDTVEYEGSATSTGMTVAPGTEYAFAVSAVSAVEPCHDSHNGGSNGCAMDQSGH